MFVDVHSHLTDEQFADDLEAVLERSRDAGVHAIITAGTSVEDSERAVELAAREENVFASVGVYPDQLPERDSDWVGKLRSLAREEKVVAIGETGLDYFRVQKCREEQVEGFKKQLELAVELGLPVVVHCRASVDDVLETVGSYAPKLRGVLHCFYGGADDMQRAVAAGFLLSVGGHMTYPKSRRSRQVVAEMPREHLLIETDSPHLPPRGHKGERNEPSLITEVAAKVALFMRLTTEEIGNIATANTVRLFGEALAESK